MLRDRRYGIFILISSRTFIAIGFTLMFALPSIYFGIFPWNFRGYEDFTSYYGSVLLMTIITGIPFVGQSLFRPLRVKLGIDNSNHDPLINLKRLPRRFVILVGLIFVTGILAKLHQISTGSFFHLNRTPYQFEQYEIFVFISNFSDYFILSGLFLLALGFKKKVLRYVWLGYGIVGIELGVGLMTGRRVLVLQLVFQLVVLKIACGWRPKLRHAMAILLGVVFLIPMMERYSILIYDIDPAKLLSVSEMKEYYRLSYQKRGDSIKDEMDKVMERLGDIRGPAAVYSVIPESIEHQWGKTYRYLLFFFIPRIIWHDKPDPREIADYTKIAIPYDPGSSPLSWVGESYLNFSWYGVFMIGCIMAFVTRRLDRWFLPRIESNVIWAVLWAAFSFRFVWVSLPLSTLFSEFLILFAVMFLIDKFMHLKVILKK